MAERISHCQFFDCSILHILVCTFWVRSRRSTQVSGAAGGLAAGLDGWRRVAATEPVQPGARRGACARNWLEHGRPAREGATRLGFLFLYEVICVTREPLTSGY